MTRTYFTLLLFFAFGANAFSQIHTTSSPAEPIGGIERLALRYYDIAFTPQQRHLLNGVELEMIYHVNDSGMARLESVNGIANRAIRDSLFGRNSDLPRFTPQINQGIAKQSLYFMRMRFPEYVIHEPYFSISYYKRPKGEDLESIEVSDTRMDLIIGGVANTFIGCPAQYLNTGGGVKLELTMTGENKMFYGMNMNVFGNKRRATFNVASTLEQYNHPNTMVIGITAGRWFERFTLQLDLNYANQNITERKEDDDSEWVQFRGFSPGLGAHYPLQIGKDQFSVDAFYGRPTLIAHYLSLSLGIRSLFMNHRATTGLLAEVGISYRFTSKLVSSYKLKDSFFKE